MQKSVASYRAQAFLFEQKKSSIAFEVKAVRAIWDPSLSIPGTNRRGGWRCPTGTRYGGQITDRFGRQCGWGVARRIANALSDIGERVEGADDRRRGRRLERRNARVGRRLAEGGLVERGARGLANALEGRNDRNPSESTIPQVEAPKVPKAPRVPTAPRVPDVAPARPARPRGNAPVAQRRRRPNLRESEARRMQREIDQPGAPRTEEGAIPQRPAPRPRPAQQRRPRQRRQDAVEQRAQETPKPAPKPRAVPRGQSDNAARSEQLRVEREQINQPKVRVEPKPAVKPKAKPDNSDTYDYAALRALDWEKGVTFGDIADIVSDLNTNEVSNYEREEQGRLRFHARIEKDALNGALQPRGTDQDKLDWLNDRIITTIDRKQREYADRARQLIQELEDANGVVERARVIDSIYLHNRLIRQHQVTRKVYLDKVEELQRAINAAAPASKPSKPTVVPNAPRNAIKAKAYVEPQAPQGIKEHFDKMNEVIAGVNDPMQRAVLINELDMAKAEALQEVFSRENILQDILVDVSNRVGRLGRKPTDDEIKQLMADAFRARMLASPYDTDVNSRYNLNQRLLKSKQDLDGAFNLVKNAQNTIEQQRAFRQYREKYATYAAIMQTNNRYKDMEAAILHVANKPQGNNEIGTTAQALQKNAADAIKAEIQRGVEARRSKVAKYLEFRYGKDGDLPWKDMTPEAWRGMTSQQKNAYLQKIYSHDKIIGDNGKIYQIVATASNGNTVQAKIYEIDSNGVQTRLVGTSSRQIRDGYVYNATLFIDGDADKNNGLATYYNQHAFMGLNAIGVKKAKVTAASDGRFVWAKVGYKPDSPPPVAPFKKALDFYEKFGGGGIIKNDEQYNLLKGLVNNMSANPRSVSHQELIFAMQQGKRDKGRDLQVKGWFLANAPINGGMLSFRAEGIVADPRVAQAPANVRKRANRPRAPRNAPQVAPNRVV